MTNMPLAKLSKWCWRDAYRFPIAVVLVFLVLRNYRQRKSGCAPDKWYWADVKLLNLGYVINVDFLP